jgi:Na+-translocating ferredoxin:NAD+ oxidoreductase RnfE subunit
MADRQQDKEIRRVFFAALAKAIRSTWPILSIFVGLMVALGITVARLEGWPMIDGVYFAFVTGLTVGYGDLVPKLLLSRAIAIALGFCGILLTGLVAAISVFSLEKALAVHTARADSAGSTKQ